jgi:lipopolysaccharide export system protein LptA
MSKHLFSFLILFLVHLSSPTHSLAEIQDYNATQQNKNQITIVSNTLEIDDQHNRVTFTGNVNAQGDEFEITCQKLDLYYHQQKQGEQEKPKIDIKRIVATGTVKILRAEGGSASAETAIYFQDEDKIVLTGNPKIKQENDFVEGTKITLFLKEKKSIVEGSEGNQVKAVVRIPERDE